MKLYYSDTLNPRKTCALARYVGLPIEFVFVDLSKGGHRSPAYLTMNPNGKVPVLSDGETTLWESNAIMCYLADKAGSGLWPDGKQIDIVRWLSWDSQHFSRYTGELYFQFIVKPRFGLGDPDAAAVEEARSYVRKYGAVLNDHLRGKNYLTGETLSVADFAVAAALPYADRAHIPIEEFPEIVRWHDRLNDLEAWRDPFPPRPH